jgi:imidazolonepropionase
MVRPKEENTCYRNIGQLVQVDPSEPGRLLIKNRAALIVAGGRVVKVQKDSALLAAKYANVVDMKGRAVIPGFVDCHTHLIFAGERKAEMEERLEGESYQEILKKGGGIHSTVSATRQATEGELFRSARKRMKRMMALGTTAFEIKTGYGLDLECELKMLAVGQRLKKNLDAPIILTYMGAHAVPAGQTREEYFEQVMDWLPRFRGLADGVDIFCERGVFSVHHLKRLFLHARLVGFHQLRAHVEELSRQGGCYEAARLGATSCDHLEYATPRDIHAMKLGGCTAVLMPGVTFFLGGKKLPLVHSMIDAGVPLALATDFNPGSAPSYNMQTTLYLASALYRLSPGQALAAATLGAARALGLERDFGALLPGQRADFLRLKTGDFRDLFYCFGENLVERTYSRGRPAAGGSQPACP